jgi:hypothetical protein
MMFADAVYECTELAARRLTDSTRKQLVAKKA